MSMMRTGLVAVVLAIAVSSAPVFAERPEDAGRPEGVGQGAETGRPNHAGRPDHAGRPGDDEQVSTTNVGTQVEEDDEEREGQITVNCVTAHVAGRSGLAQIRGGGLHLVIETDEAGAMSVEDLTAAATLVANSVCNTTTLSTAAAEALETSVNALADVEVSHSNTYGASEDDED